MNNAEDVDILRAMLLDAYAEWEGSSEDMLGFMAAHLAPRVTIQSYERVSYLLSAAESNSDDF